MGDDSEWMKLSTEDKVQHKAWKARLTGYEECTKLFRKIDDEKSAEFSKYAPLVKKFVTDSNAVAQEKAMEAVIAFVECAAVAPKTCSEVVSGVVLKCLCAPKQKTKDNGKEIIMLYIEAEKQDAVEECLIEGLSNKNPKVVVGCVLTLAEALREFGNKIIQIKPLVKFLPKLMEDRDKSVRDGAKQLVVEMYRWVGAAIKPKLVDMKPVLLTELEAEFEKLANEKPQQTRFLRSQEDLKAKMEEKAARAEEGEEEEEEEEEREEVDPYDLIEPVNILPMLPKDFFEKVEAKKWQERKEVLEAVQKLCENPKIEPGDHGNLVRALIKVVGKDSNVMLVVVGCKCLTGLAKGLRAKFSPYATQCFSVIIEKFKEKKVTVVTALRDAADAVYSSINLDPITEDILTNLENKNPSIKAETASFLARAFARQTLATLPKKQLKVFCGALLKTINDTAPEVREASFQALGTAMKVVSEKNIMVYMADVDQIKMAKIKECHDSAVLLNAKGEPRSGGATAKSAAAKPAAAKPAKTEAKAEPPRMSTARPKSAPAPKKGGGKKAAASSGPAEEKTEKIISDEEVVERATELLSESVLTQLESANWKERLDATEKFTAAIKSRSRGDIPCQVCVRALCRKPGLKDNNFQVLKLKIDLIVMLAQNAEFTRTSADFCLPDLVDKIGDVKNGAGVQLALSCIAEAVSLETIAAETMKLAFEQKNPKNQSEALNWLAKAITEFGLKLKVKGHLINLKKAFAATNPAVRTSAINVVSVLYLYMGAQLRVFFEDEKPALLQQIDAEFEKLKGQKPPAPVRGLKGAVEEEEEGEEGEAGRDGEGDDEGDADLVPRNDVGDKFTDDLLTSLSDKNWKVRGEGLQKIISILNEAKFVTPNLGSLPEALKARLGDANKILVTTTIGICVTLATCLGRHCKQHIKVIGPALIGCLADSKPTLRSAAIGALNAWVDQTTLLPLAECETFSDALKLEKPFLRQELLAWLIERLPSHKPLPKEEMKACIPLVLICLEDRNPDVRKNAQDALVPFMIHTGYDAFFKASSKAKPASKDQLVAMLEKARENLPAKPKKAPAPAAAPKTVKGGGGNKAAPPPVAAAAAADDDYDDEPEPAKKEKSPPSEDTKVKKGKAKPAAAPSKKKKVEEDTGPVMTLTETKEKRFKDEKNMKTLKWNFTDPRGEYVEQLRTQMEKNFSKSMIDLMFSSDFKHHTKAIENLIKCIDNLQNEQLGNLDLILKWFTFRFFDTNPSMLNKALEYIQAMFDVLINIDYSLHELEATSFIPYLVIKVGENKDNVRRDVRKIFKQLYKLYPASKMFVFISDGIKSKNSKQRTECLEELGYLIETYGISICQPTPAVALKVVAAQISDRDNGVRNAALNTTVVAWQILGDNLYKHIGTLKEKDQSYLDERIKRSSKSKPAPKENKENRPKSAPAPAQAKKPAPGQIPRPGTAGGKAMPKSQSSNSVRKEFQLEIDEDSDREIQVPKLIQYDLDDLLQPVEMPKIKGRPASPSTKFFSSTETSNTVNYVISQVTNRDISTCTQALAQIDEVLKDRDKVSVMEDHVEQLLVAMSMQFKIAYCTHLDDVDTAKDDVIKLYRCLLGTLLALFQNPTLATHASKDMLKELVYNLVTMLLDNRLMELEDGPQVVRSVNVLVVKIMEKSDQTNTLCALIHLLQECCVSATCSNKFIELIMKCLWKMVRQLPDNINELNLDKVLYEIHVFLEKLPSSSWKERANDLPLRTIKTILHSLAKLKGSKIMSHFSQIDSAESSEVRTFLTKVLKNEGVQVTEQETNGSTDDDKSQKTTGKKKRLSDTTHDILTEIFRKIGSKENTKEGLQDLYDFKKKYPDADLDPFLKKSSHFFQNYIERGLKAIEAEQLEKGGTSEPGSLIEKASRLTKSKLGGKDLNVKEADPVDGAPYYRERLRMLRAQCGLEPSVNPQETEMEAERISSPPLPSREVTLDTASTEPQSEPEAPEMSNDADTKAQKLKDVSQLKARLERIKQLANS